MKALLKACAYVGLAMIILGMIIMFFAGWQAIDRFIYIIKSGTYGAIDFIPSLAMFGLPMLVVGCLFIAVGWFIKLHPLWLPLTIVGILLTIELVVWVIIEMLSGYANASDAIFILLGVYCILEGLFLESARGRE